MKSISDIFNSMVQPTEQHSLLGGNQSASAQNDNPSVGSFSDVLSRLNSQNASTANVTPNEENSATTNTNSQNAGSTGNSESQITITEVQVTENIQSNNLNPNTLANIENAATAMAMALAKLVNLASTVQNFNQSQAQNLIVSASGGAINALQAQQLVVQIANLKNQNSGQNALTLTPEQQTALLLQMMQSMFQNQQITLTQSSDTQNNQNSLLSDSQGSSLLQFNFSGNQNGQNGSGQVESLSIDIQTLNLQVTGVNQQGSTANSAQSINLTDATTQKLTQLLQQLNVTPLSTPANIQVQSTVSATSSPDLVENFQNLIQILTQAGAGQAVLNTYLTQNKNNGATNNFGQVANQLSQVQNPSAIQSVSVSPVNNSEPANSVFVSANNKQNNSAAGQPQLLNDSLGGQNIQLTTQNTSVQNNPEIQTSAFSTNVKNLPADITAQTTSIQTTNNPTQTSFPITNTPTVEVSAVINATHNASVQLTNNQSAPALPVVANSVQTVSVQPINNQPPSTAPAINAQITQVSAANPDEMENENHSAANPNSQTSLSQPQDIFSNGQLEALNGIVARFNNGVVSGQAVVPAVINYKNNINLFPTETQAENQVLNQTAPVQVVLPVQTVTPATPTVIEAANIVLNNQNTQLANNLTINNIQNQLVQPTSPTAQQVINSINDSAQDSFAQTAAIPTAANLANTTVGTPTVIETNNSNITANLPALTTPGALAVALTSTSGSGTPLTVAFSAPVVTQPVINPSVTAQSIPAATVAGETAKAAVPALVQSNANNNNAPVVSPVPSVSAASSVQPVTAQAVSQAANSSETSTNLNTAGNSTKDTLADTANLQSLAAAVNAGISTTDKLGNTFQNTVNTVSNSNPNGNIDSAQIMNQITQQVASQTADAKMVSRLSFQLVPESLGRVTIQVALVDQSISARIMVSNPDIREVLQQHMVDLKAALSQAGLQIDQMQVQVQGGGSNLLAQYYQYQQEGNSYRESAWTPTNTSEQPQNADNTAVLTTAGSSSLNFLV